MFFDITSALKIFESLNVQFSKIKEDVLINKMESVEL